MKKLLITVWFPLAFLACATRNDGPPPDAGTAISGEYILNRVISLVNDDTVSNIILPQTNGISTRTGTLVVARNTESTVNLSVVQYVQQLGGVSSMTTTFGKMNLLATATGNGYELYQFNRKSGTANGTTIAIELSDTYQPTMTTTRYILEARR